MRGGKAKDEEEEEREGKEEGWGRGECQPHMGHGFSLINTRTGKEDSESVFVSSRLRRGRKEWGVREVRLRVRLGRQ